MIATYEYYRNTYQGTKYDNEAQYNKAEKRAELELSKYIDITAEPLSDNVVNCCCSLVDILAACDSVQDTLIKGVSSESVSGYSVSYSNTFQISAGIRKRIRDEIMLWLGSSIETCRGVGRSVV